MKCESSSDVIHKEVVIIGNGPSGIALSFMLSGNLPFVISDYHPDEMLSARLHPVVGQCLVSQDLEHLAAGLEGRSTNFISLLLDALLHPCADMGLEMEPLVEFRRAGVEIDHIVLGKGPPGGTWHNMDPHILTLSLGSWMALPTLPFICRDSGEKRAYARSVAKYYEQYVQQKQLTKYFKSQVTVTNIKPINKSFVDVVDRYNNDKIVKKTERLSVCMEPECENIPEEKKTCFISNAINCLLSKAQTKKSRCFKRRHDPNREQSPCRKIRELENNERDFLLRAKRDKSRSISLCCDSTVICDSVYSKSLDDYSHSTLRNSYSLDFDKPRVPSLSPSVSYCNSEDKWLVESVNESGKKILYSCKYLVLANGVSDVPNKLNLSDGSDPSWLVHDLRSLECQLDRELQDTPNERMDPVLIVGAGLSAADAIIATRGRNIPVVHIFRNKSADLNKQLPENMYPEYHKVHQMMKDGGVNYPLYTAYAEYTLTSLDEQSHTAILTSKSGEQVKLNVSFAAVLIGSRPDLSFLSSDKQNSVNSILTNKSNHTVYGYKNLFAIGPLADDNFVRFIPGGALAVVAELYRQNKYM